MMGGYPLLEPVFRATLKVPPRGASEARLSGVTHHEDK
ncbi:hypothetical protein ASAP_2458 [Asaia bogorensis]|uniref:Uncharacterized protein n=1 Tax=Asaia bogorensis TaxID=91915 RepID=A0A060QIG8_9PROT|nr:hypothetical protein P792_05995 [Asaia sp. SF2.1]CDG40503.1 hypothetical protein ASAP_2458 [Asaia bogorensis]